MTAAMPEPDVHSADTETVHRDDTVIAGPPVVVRRNAGLAALVGAGASAIAIAYLWRATQSSAPLDWVLCLVMAGVAASFLANLVDARTPLLVADDLGVRIRLGNQWRGLPWDAVGKVVVQPRRGAFHDGRLMFSPHSLSRALDGLDARGRRAAALNQKVYGAALSVPIGLSTRVSAQGPALADRLSALAQGRTDVVLVEPDPTPAEDTEDTEPTTGQVVEPTPLDRAAAVLAVQADETADVDEPAHGDLPAYGYGSFDVDPGTDVDGTAAADRTAEVDRTAHGDGAAYGWTADDGEVTDDDRSAYPAEPGELSGATAADFDAADAADPDAADPDAADPDGADSDVADAEAGSEGSDSTRPSARWRFLGTLGTIVSRVAKGRSHDVDAAPADASGEAADDADDEATVGDGTADGVGEAEARDSRGDGSTYGDAAGSPGDRTLGDVPAEDDPADVEPGALEKSQAPAPVRPAAVPLRAARHGVRAEVTRDTPATVLGSAALLPDTVDGRRTPLPEGRELRRPGSVDLEFEAPGTMASGRVRPISSLGDPVEPLVIDDFVTEPAYDPVIGPELAAARTRVGLSVDELAERTRIRPHVIESIEVDDFAPCGGDFYARGHLRTLARVLGKDPAPLLEQFDKRYATAPINARRVFEAELATGMTGSMRSTIGGPNWSLLIGVVLALVMTWGVVRLFASEPPEELRSPIPVLNGSAGVHQGAAGNPGSDTGGSAAGTRGKPVTPVDPAVKPVELTLVGAQADSHVVVRDRAGTVVWAGDIVLGEKRTVSAVPPVRVRAANAGAITVQVDGKRRGAVGELDQPGRRTFHRPR